MGRARLMGLPACSKNLKINVDSTLVILGITSCYIKVFFEQSLIIVRAFY